MRISILLLLLLSGTITGCGVNRKKLHIFPDDNSIIEALWVHDYVEISRGACIARRNRVGYNLCINENIRRGPDYIAREIINKHNERNGTNFNAMADYKITSVWQGVFRTPRGGHISGTISGILLEIKE